MNFQALVKLEKVNWRVMPLRESVSCQSGKRLTARWGRSAGWLAEKIMSCAAGTGGDRVSMVAGEDEVDSGRRRAQGVYSMASGTTAGLCVEGR